MLKSLSIANYAILEQVEIAFDKELNIITGETGAGKSILLGALGLVMGQRVDTKVLFKSDQKCVVEAVYVNYPSTVNQVLKEFDLDCFDELLIRREIIPSGRSRAFVNDTPTNLDVLQRISLALIDLNQQFQIYDIQSQDFQLSIVDALADSDKLLTSYGSVFKEYKEIQKELNEVENVSSAQLKELDFLKFQFEELTNASISDDEIENIESEVGLLEKTEDIALLVDETKYLLSDSDTNIGDLIQNLALKWDEIADLNDSGKHINDAFNELIELKNNIYQSANDIKDKLHADPSRVGELRNRLDVLYSFQRKHGVQSTKQLIEIREAMAQKIGTYANRDEQILKLKTKFGELELKLSQLSEKLTKKRKKVFPSLTKQVNANLDALAMPSAEIHIDHEVKDDFGKHGKDAISFLFKANKGTQFQAIKKIASGGESSRLMLAVKATVADKMALPTMIFDEIDTGVSGEVAKKMGNILSKLAKRHQLICITHSPQVSSKATQHLFVYKQETAKRTKTKVKLLNKDERIIEIAKMLSGDPPSTYALDNAKDLLHSKT